MTKENAAIIKYIKSSEERMKSFMKEGLKDLESNMNARFKDVDTRFESMESRFESMESRFDSVDIRFDIQSKEILALREDVDVIKGTMATKDDIHDVKLSIEHLTTTTQRIDQDNYALKEWLKRHDIQLGSYGKRLAKLETAR